MDINIRKTIGILGALAVLGGCMSNAGPEPATGSTRAPLITPDQMLVTAGHDFTTVDSFFGEVAPTGTLTGYRFRLENLASHPASADSVLALSFGDVVVVDPKTGAASLAGRVEAGGPQMIETHPTTRVIYAVAGIDYDAATRRFYRRLGMLAYGNTLYGTWHFTEIGRMYGDEIHFRDIAFSPDGVLYAVRNGKLFTIDLQTAEVHPVGRGEYSASVSITFSAAGHLYALANDYGEGPYDGHQIFELDPRTGAPIAGPIELRPSVHGSPYSAIQYTGEGELRIGTAVLE